MRISRTWKLVRRSDGCLIYDIRVNGITIDLVRIEEPALKYLKSKGFIDERA